MTSRRTSGLSSSGFRPLPTPSSRRWVEQRLLSDPSPTTLFLQLARQNLSDDKIPMKKVRNYLWNQPYISRFNEEGKKTKSKGNHIWHIDAKKGHDGSWKFRPFRRRLAGSPPTVAYVGLRWSWQPHVWDPQGAEFSGSVRYSSPTLPAWLSWKDDVLSGVPPPDAQSCEITVTAGVGTPSCTEAQGSRVQPVSPRSPTLVVRANFYHGPS